jgi:hypothetical protein
MQLLRNSRDDPRSALAHRAWLKRQLLHPERPLANPGIGPILSASSRYVREQARGRINRHGKSAQQF